MIAESRGCAFRSTGAHFGGPQDVRLPPPHPQDNRVHPPLQDKIVPPPPQNETVPPPPQYREAYPLEPTPAKGATYKLN